MSKKLRSNVLILLPGVVCYLYNLFLGVVNAVSVPRDMYFQNLFKFIVIYNLFFNLIMVLLAKGFEIKSAKNYIENLNYIFAK